MTKLPRSTFMANQLADSESKLSCDDIEAILPKGSARLVGSWILRQFANAGGQAACVAGAPTWSVERQFAGCLDRFDNWL